MILDTAIDLEVCHDTEHQKIEPQYNIKRFFIATPDLFIEGVAIELKVQSPRRIIPVNSQ